MLSLLATNNKCFLMPFFGLVVSFDSTPTKRPTQCEIKFVFYGKTGNVNNLPLAFGLLFPHYCALSICIMPNLLHQQKSTIKSNILLTSKQFLERWHSFLIFWGVTWPTMMVLRSGLYKLSIIQHFMYSLLSQKTYLCLDGWNSSYSFLIFFVDYNPQIWLK